VDELKRNGSGYYDPTAWKAISNIEKDAERFRKVLNAIFVVCDLAGFHVEGRITLRDKKTGKIWR
jgi:hypothetical protein